MKKRAWSSSESPLSPFINWHVTQISNKQQCQTVRAVNGLKKNRINRWRRESALMDTKSVFALIYVPCCDSTCSCSRNV